MKLYEEAGWLNWDEIWPACQTYTFITGGRGIGKTFGALKYAIDHGIKFIFLRRTQKQVKMIRRPELNPFKALENEYGEAYRFSFMPLGDDITAVMKEEDPEPIALMLPLTTISSLRGFDASKMDAIIYDEFIPEKHERKIQDEGSAFLNAIETVARNRELKGREPLRVFCLSNSNLLANPLYIELKIVNKVYNMIKKGQEISHLPERNLSIIHITKSPISEAKKNTSLYKLAAGSSFVDMALDNSFTEVDDGQVKTLPLSELRPLVNVGELCIYRHKSKQLYYITTHRSGNPPEYGSSETELKRFFNDYFFLKVSHFARHIYFQDYTLLTLFEAYIKL